jgi:HAE1 family hydrophobic/amphiphilic exporter-1
MWITKTSIDNPVFATMVMVAITVLGIFSYRSLSIEQMPDTALPFVFVQTRYPGASPEVVETDVTKPIEYAVNQVSGVKRIYSTTREGRSDVVAEFRLLTDVATTARGSVRPVMIVLRQL